MIVALCLLLTALCFVVGFGLGKQGGYTIGYLDGRGEGREEERRFWVSNLEFADKIGEPWFGIDPNMMRTRWHNP